MENYVLEKQVLLNGKFKAKLIEKLLSQEIVCHILNIKRLLVPLELRHMNSTFTNVPICTYHNKFCGFLKRSKIYRHAMSLSVFTQRITFIELFTRMLHVVKRTLPPITSKKFLLPWCGIFSPWSKLLMKLKCSNVMREGKKFQKAFKIFVCLFFFLLFISANIETENMELIHFRHAVEESRDDDYDTFA